MCTGLCDGDNYWPPRCVNCSLSMGDSCQYDCINGTELTPFSTECTCDPCFTGFSCDVECSTVGQCLANANSTMVGISRVMCGKITIKLVVFLES